MNNPGVFGDALDGQGVSAAGGNTGVAEGTTHSLTVAGAWVVSPNFVVGQPGPAASTVGSV